MQGAVWTGYLQLALAALQAQTYRQDAWNYPGCWQGGQSMEHFEQFRERRCEKQSSKEIPRKFCKQARISFLKNSRCIREESKALHLKVLARIQEKETKTKLDLPWVHLRPPQLRLWRPARPVCPTERFKTQPVKTPYKKGDPRNRLS